jgi:hypothetical protein
MTFLIFGLGNVLRKIFRGRGLDPSQPPPGFMCVKTSNKKY